MIKGTRGSVGLRQGMNEWKWVRVIGNIYVYMCGG